MEPEEIGATIMGFFTGIILMVIFLMFYDCGKKQGIRDCQKHSVSESCEK